MGNGSKRQGAVLNAPQCVLLTQNINVAVLHIVDALFDRFVTAYV